MELAHSPSSCNKIRLQAKPSIQQRQIGPHLSHLQTPLFPRSQQPFPAFHQTACKQVRAAHKKGKRRELIPARTRSPASPRYSHHLQKTEQGTCLAPGSESSDSVCLRSGGERGTRVTWALELELLLGLLRRLPHGLVLGSSHRGGRLALLSWPTVSIQNSRDGRACRRWVFFFKGAGDGEMKRGAALLWWALSTEHTGVVSACEWPSAYRCNGYLPTWRAERLSSGPGMQWEMLSLSSSSQPVTSIELKKFFTSWM
jgi:hypothetical protein